MQLQLTPEEATALNELLSSAISDLHVEVRHTDSSSYRHELHERERVLRGVLDRLEPDPIGAA